jgi:hypothetical protein
MRTVVAFCSGAILSAATWTYLDIATDARSSVVSRVHWPVSAPQPAANARSAPPQPRKADPHRQTPFRMPTWTPLEPLPAFVPVPPEDGRATTTHAAPPVKAATIDAEDEPPSFVAWPAAAARPPLRWAIAASTGVEAYRDPALDSAIAWGVAVQAEPWDYASLELGYLGTSSSDGASTSVEAVGRLTPLRGGLRPYLFAGAGWRYFHGRAPRGAGVFPHGAGLLIRHGRWRGEARVTLRPMSDQTYRAVSASTQLGMEF